jgi:hypothetical protein
MTKELSEKELQELVAKNLALLDEADKAPEEDTLAGITTKLNIYKKVVCPFYKGGGFKVCLTCTNPDDAVEDCGEAYRAQMDKRFAEVWSKDLAFPKKRDKILLQNVEVGLKCDSCYLSKNCPYMEEDSVCAIEWTPDIDFNSPHGLAEYLVKLQAQRIERAKLVEVTDGGVPDQILSMEMDRFSRLVAMQNDLSTNKLRISIDQTTQSGSQSGGGGILAQLFGLGAPKQALPEAQEVEAIEIKEAVKVLSKG